MLTPFTRTGVGHKIEDLNKHHHGLVRMNELMTRVLTGFQPVMHNRGFIVRCESLPVVMGEEQSYQEGFSKLISLILHIGVEEGPIFLHIDCRALSPNEQEELALKELGLKTLIRLHTNLEPAPGWQEQLSAELHQIRQQLEQTAALLLIDCNGQSGCFFNIAVPSK